MEDEERSMADCCREALEDDMHSSHRLANN